MTLTAEFTFTCDAIDPKHGPREGRIVINIQDRADAIMLAKQAGWSCRVKEGKYYCSICKHFPQTTAQQGA